MEEVQFKTPSPETNTSLSVLIEKSKERLAAMSEEERQAMWQAQRESFARGMSTPCEHGVLDFEQCPQCRNPSPSTHVVPDFRALAVEIVDGIRGYTYEYSGSPDAHLADYDLIEERLSTVFAGKPVSCVWDCVDAPMDVCPTTGMPCPSTATPPPQPREVGEQS